RIRALADELGAVSVETIGALGDSLVHVPEKCFHGRPPLVLVHAVSLRPCRLTGGRTRGGAAGLRSVTVSTWSAGRSPSRESQRFFAARASAGGSRRSPRARQLQARRGRPSAAPGR